MHTENGREFAVQKLHERRASKPVQKDNGRLPAGSPMTFYCVTCGHVSDVLPELFLGRPKHLCNECEALKELGWLE